MVLRVGRFLPHGWGDFLFQLALWFGFILAYQVARGLADRGPLEAFENGRLVIDAERSLHTLVEADLQRVVIEAGGPLLAAVNWTYWLAQFVVLGLALLWIYVRHNEVFPRVRNWVLGTNMVALIGYVLLPTTPPRFFPEEGFVDTLAQSGAVNHGSGLVELASNPYAAMPSIHAADALIIGFAMAMLVRARWARVAWTLWPTWVWFTVMATGNHFWLDVAAGVGVAALAATMLAWIEGREADDRLSTALSRRRHCS